MQGTGACEICGQASYTSPVIFPNGDQKKLCKKHVDDILSSLKEQNAYYEKEIVGFKYVVMIIAVIVGSALSMIVYTKYWPPIPWPFSGIPYLALSLAYIIAFTTPSIYKRVLQAGPLEQISVTHRVRQLEAKDIMQINATVIAGALILLTLLQFSSTIGLGSNLALYLGMSANQMIACLTGTVVLIFAFSAIAVSIFRYTEIGRRLMVAGFVYLFFAILALTYFGYSTLPNITNVSPSNLSFDVPLSSAITAKFSEPMQSTSITKDTFIVMANNKTHVSGAVTLTPDGQTAVFAPRHGLKNNTTYEATITNEVTDNTGNHMLLDKTWSFTTCCV